MVKSALDVMAICSISPRGQMQFCERVELPDDTKSVAFNILLGNRSYKLRINCSKLSKTVQKCQKMPKNVKKCQKMSKNVKNVELFNFIQRPNAIL